MNNPTSLQPLQRERERERVKPRLLRFLLNLGSALIVGVSVGAIVMAFNNPPGNPTTGGGIIGVGSGAPAGSLYINSSGNVGIRTTNPTNILDVRKSTADAGDIMAIGDTIAGRALVFGEGVNASYGYITPAAGDATKGIVITSAGNVGIGTTEPSAKLHVVQSSSDSRIELSNSVGASRQTLIFSLDDTANEAYIFPYDYGAGVYLPLVLHGNPLRLLGNVGIGMNPTSYQLQLSTNSAGKPGGGSWSDSSDIRLKRNITPITGALDKITQLQGVNFEWVNPDEHQALGIRQGFIAQAVEKVFPNFITEIGASGEDKALTDNGKIKSLSLPFDFDAYLVEAIKELKAENDALKQIICADHPQEKICK